MGDTQVSITEQPDEVIAVMAVAFRVLRPGGRPVVFDGEYAVNTVALYSGDPLQTGMEAVQRSLIHATFVMRGLPAAMARAGFEPEPPQGHSYILTSEPECLLSVI